MASAILLLTGDEERFITGAVLPVDGDYIAGKWLTDGPVAA